MRQFRNACGTSKVILVLLLFMSFIIGALLSYIYTMGYYAPSEFRLPEEPTITIQSVEFSKQDTLFFNVTVLNPSYSPSDVNITRIEARTTDDNKIHTINDVMPTLPFMLGKGHYQTFRATWHWANYTGIKLPYTDTQVEIRVFIQDGRGEILELKRPLTRLVITSVEFNPSVSVNHFNLTVQNLQLSETYVNITAFSIEGQAVPQDRVTPSLPYTLNPGDSPVQFQCFYDWHGFMNQSATVKVDTLQGYISQQTFLLPQPVILNIPQIVFNATVNTAHFNITVSNAANSSTYVDISKIEVATGTEAPVEISQWTPDPSSRLEKNASILILCPWDWSSFGGQSLTVKVTVYTSQGFAVSKEAQIP